MRWMTFVVFMIVIATPLADVSAYETVRESAHDVTARGISESSMPGFGSLHLIQPILGRSTSRLASLAAFGEKNAMSAQQLAAFEFFGEGFASRLRPGGASNGGEAGDAMFSPAQSAPVYAEQRISLVPRLFLGALTNLGVSFLIALPVVALLYVAILGILVGSPVVFFGALVAAVVLALVGAVLLVPLVVKAVGDLLGGEGTYLATVLGAVVGIAVNIAIQSLVTLTPIGQTAAGTAVILIGSIVSMFGPVAGYEISSHQRRERRSIQVGISPLVGASENSEFSLQGAALAFSVRF